MTTQPYALPTQQLASGRAIATDSGQQEVLSLIRASEGGGARLRWEATGTAAIGPQLEMRLHHERRECVTPIGATLTLRPLPHRERSERVTALLTSGGPDASCQCIRTTDKSVRPLTPAPRPLTLCPQSPILLPFGEREGGHTGGLGEGRPQWRLASPKLFAPSALIHTLPALETTPRARCRCMDGVLFVASAGRSLERPYARQRYGAVWGDGAQPAATCSSSKTQWPGCTTRDSSRATAASASSDGGRAQGDTRHYRKQVEADSAQPTGLLRPSNGEAEAIHAISGEISHPPKRQR